MADPYESSGLSITLKQESRDGMWMVFHGSPARLRADIIETFALDGAKYADYNLHDLALEAQRLYRGIGNVSTILGGKPAEDVHQGAQQASEQPKEAHPLVALVEGCESVADLQSLYKRNADEFKADKELLTLWKAKGKALAGAK